MFEIAAIDHIVLRTSHLDRMLDFYCRVLGCQIERQTAAETGLTQLRAGSALIDLITVEGQLGCLGGGPPTATENNLDHFCLQLRPISEHQIGAHLQSHGIEVPEFSSRYGAQGRGKSIYLKDPDGNTVELRSQLPPGV